ncbi:cobalamin biosynthesis protein, partial [Klebsiella pneumoniae]|uniref:cobalamin biosynthesis protein n=1 Tax=Klebsiella pneumoniae TaxID=573 RepID=UPI0013D29CFD
AMIAVGLGLRPGTERIDIKTCIEAALGRIDLGLSDVGCLATVAARAAEPGLIALAAEIGAPVIGIPDEALRGQDAGCATR